MSERRRISTIVCALALGLLSVSGNSAIHSKEIASDFETTVDRRSRTLSVRDKNGKVILDTKVGIGKGGLKDKRSMSDCITPEGDFFVDIILSRKYPQLNTLDKKYLLKYRGDKQSSEWLSSQKGLGELFSSMNSIDFDGDGKADSAYGDAYIGLDSKQAICGPKLSKFKGKRYWFSIAIHGTEREADNISQANSGGCIQIPSPALDRLLQEKLIGLASRVKIK